MVQAHSLPYSLAVGEDLRAQAAANARQPGAALSSRAAAAARPTLGVADDDVPFLRTLNQARGTRSLHCYDSAASVLEAGELARAGDGAAPWDAVIVSIGLPDLHGNAVIARLRDWFPRLTIWAAIGAEESHSLIGAICAGADGYLIKSCKAEGERASLAALDAGQPPLGRSLAVSLLQLAGDSLWSRPSHAPSGLPARLDLSRTQLQLLRLIARGDSIPVAAGRMTLPADTAWLLLRDIYRHLRRAPLCVAVPQTLRLQVLAELGAR